MKRVFKISLATVAGVILLGSMALAQDKTEKKIKIVIDDKNGSGTVIDTTFSGPVFPDSLVLKDGDVIYIEHGKEKMTGSDDKEMKNQKITVRVNGDGNGGKTITKEITVIPNDSDASSASGVAKSIYVISDGNARTETSYNVNVSDGDDTGSQQKKSTVYYNIRSNNESSQNSTGIHGDQDKTSYVIAKDGMVVTIEGGDEQKVKELAGFIESKLGLDNDSKAVKKSTSSETKGSKK